MKKTFKLLLPYSILVALFIMPGGFILFTFWFRHTKIYNEILKHWLANVKEEHTDPEPSDLCNM